MELEFFVNASDSKAVTKSLTSLGIIENVTMRDALNDRTPVFLVESNALPTNYNYSRCSYTGRYYFVEHSEAVRNGLTAVYCVCDVLMTFNAYIRAQIATVTRNENLTNGYLIDNKYNAYAYQEIVTKQFPNEMANDSLILMTVG